MGPARRMELEMKVTCLGAARTVTGSCYLVEADSGDKMLVDCGMFQGGRQIEKRNRMNAPYAINKLKAILITHAHMDHSGLVPRMVRKGYKGPVYASKATCELLRPLWLDSAHIQQMEAEWKTRKNKRKGGEAVEPLYETADSEAACALLIPVEMDQTFEVVDGVDALLVNAGHILGASSIFLTLRGKTGVHRVGFSGDLGRPNQLIVPNPEVMPAPDTVFMETTYGNRTHKTLDDSQAELLEVIHTAYKEGGKVMIPAFAVERSQELIYTLAAAYRRGDFPKDMPVYLDSPLAIKTTNIFRKHPEFFDEETREILANGDTPLNFPNLKFTLSTDESRAINETRESAVIMAGSGMAHAGRIKHHLKHNLWRANCHVVIVGFQAQGTTGRLLVEGAEKVKIFREDVAVRAKVHTIGGFSAHADRDELLLWLGALAHPGMMVNLMHGEESSSLAFQELAQEHFKDMHFYVPKWKEILTLGGHVEPPVRIEPSQVAQKALRVREQLAALDAAKLDDADLAKLDRALMELERLAAVGGVK